MSASSKKKLRAEENAAKLTEKQLAQQKEDRKTRIYTITFALVLAVLVIAAAVTGVNMGIRNSGVREKNTVALTIGDTTLSNAELNYYFGDTVNQFYSQNGSYMSLFGLQAGVALDQQVYDEESGETWADYFLDAAENSAKATYALYNDALANGYTISEDGESQVTSTVSTLSLYAQVYGYSDAEGYLKAMYGNGATLETYENYLRTSVIASEYQSKYQNELTFTADEMNAKSEEDSKLYNSYSYNQYYISTSRYLDDEATNEERAAAAEADAKTLVGEEIDSVEALDAAIAALEVNAESSAKSTSMDATRYSSVNSTISEWVTDETRVEGDKTYVASTSTTTGDDGNEVTNVSGYYVVYYIGSTDNTFPLVNVRHILAGFEGGTTDENGNTTYSDEEKATAKRKAEDLLAEFLAGDKTEDSFAALATENTTDTGSQENGGLYENVYPGQMVEAFNDWCFDSSRQAGDTGVVETTYGYHIMYFVGNADQSYREYLIHNDLVSEAYNQWYTDLVESTTMTVGNTKYVNTGIAFNAN